MYMDGWATGCLAGWMDGSIDACKSGWVDGFDGGMDEWMNGWRIDEWMYSGMDGWMADG